MDDLDYQEYNRIRPMVRLILIFAWLAQRQAGLLEEDDGLSDIKDVATVGGGIFVVATALILLGSFIMKRRKEHLEALQYYSNPLRTHNSRST